MEKEFITLLTKMNEGFDKLNKRFDEQDKRFDKQDKRFDEQDKRFDELEQFIKNEMKQVNERLDHHEQHLIALRKMTAQNTENLTAFRHETNERFDKLELSTYKMQSNIEFLYQETLNHKQDISQLKSQ